MYTLLILIFMIIAPIPVMSRYMISGRNPYRGVLDGALTAIAGTSIVFLLFYALTGAALFDVITSSLNQVSFEEFSAAGGYDLLKTQGLSSSELNDVFEKSKEIMKMSVPGVMIIAAFIVSYFNYLIVSKILKKKISPFSALPPFRAFTLPRTAILGSFVIYGLGYLTVKAGIVDSKLLMFSLEMLFNFMFSVQGLAVVFFFGYVKKIPKAVVVVLAVIMVGTFIGQTFLFILGLTDIIIDARKRFYQTNLKI